MTATAAVPIAIVERSSPLEGIADEITVGKDVLELVTGAMYADPLSVYREYVQNAADAIDEARATGKWAGKPYVPHVQVEMDRDERGITIRDNGVGVPNGDFVARLTAIGGSKKRGANYRGFRGVGRLSGLGYCQELVFRSRALGDNKICEIYWDGRRLRDVLRDSGFRGGLTDAIRAVAKVRKVQPKDEPAQFFEVQLRKVIRVKNDVLLNEEVVRSYLSQVAPVPFHPDFSAGAEIQAYLDRFKAATPFAIELNDGGGLIYRPHRGELPVSEKQTDRLYNPRFFEIPGLHEEVAAIGWTLQHSYYGAWSRRLGVGGLRVRLGNLQIGGADLLASHFVEPRFNQWCIGEMHILSNRLTPNGRRDDFEHSSHYDNFIAQISPKLADLTRICREQSELRQKLRTANQYVQKARHALIAMRSRNASQIVRRVSEWQCRDALKGLAHTAKSRSLTSNERHVIGVEYERLERELKRIARRAGRDPFAIVDRRRREDVEALVRLVFDRFKNQKKAEEFARRVIKALR